MRLETERPPRAEGSARSLLEGAARGVLQGGVAALRHGAAAAGGLLRALGAEAAGRRAGEIEAKVRVFEGFRFADEAAARAGEMHGSPPASGLAGVVAAALRLAPEDAVWVLEGLGASRGPAAARPGAGPGTGISPRWWIPLHTGTGMAFAEETLARTAGASPRELARAVAELAERCVRSSAPGYALATFEPAGFMVRMLAPRRVGDFAAALRIGLAGEPAWRAAFHHGLGRSYYFSPFPISAARALEAAWRAGPSPGADPAEARAEAIERLTGAAWAMTLVHLPRPARVEEGLGAARALPAEAHPAIADGVASAVRLWHHGRGVDPVLRAFLDHRGGPDWERLAAAPVRRAVERAGEPGTGGPGALFRHHPGGPP